MLYKDIIADSQRIPHFIDINKTEHCNALNSWSDIVLTISNCVCKKILPKNNIDELAADIFVLLNKIFIMTEDKTYYKIFQLSKIRIDYYIQIACNEELYETAQNLKNLKDCLQSTIIK